MCLINTNPKSPKLIAIGKLRLVGGTSYVVCSELSSPRLLKCTKVSYRHVCMKGTSQRRALPRRRVGRLLIRGTGRCRYIIHLGKKSIFIFKHKKRRNLCLQRRKVSCAIIPKIASTVTKPTCTKVPIARHNITADFQIVAKRRGGKRSLSRPSFAAVSSSGRALVFLVKLSEMERVISKLVRTKEGQRAPTTIVSRTAARTRRVYRNALRGLTSHIRRTGLASPTLVVIKSIITLHHRLRFFRRGPL